ncbi:MAG: radical SAM protein [Bryobacterales bacterium]|nr:radical SAM protein [Bryobacteraceae bacterium]MDW8355683.1 radical SAM protein [Bryobacterales bacterium]
MIPRDSLIPVGTGTRRKVSKLTAPLLQPRHRLEGILSRPLTRKMLAWLAAPGPDGRSLFERLCENYDNPHLRGWERVKWTLPSLAIDWGLSRAGLDKQLMKEKLFHHHPTVRALALTARSVARYGLREPQRFAAPLFVVWNITQLCNLNCKHCYQNAGPRPAPDELTLEERLRVVDELAANGVPFLAIAGGEPLALKDLWPVLEHANRRGIHLTMATNGTLLTPEKAARLKACGVKYVEISVDGLDPHEHDAFRGRKGAWAQAIQGIRNAVAAGIRTGFATCFTRRNVDRAEEMVEFAIQLGCQTFSHFNFIPVGRGREIMEEDLTPAQRERLLRTLEKYLQEGRINVISTAPQFGRACVVYGPQEGAFATGHAGRGRGSKTMVLARYIGGCGAGRCYCSIQPNGTVTPCVYISSIQVGDLRRQSFEEIWNNELFALLAERSRRGDHCAVCDYKAYCGGCRARAFSYTGDIAAGDPGCVYNYHLWDELEARARQELPVLAAPVRTEAPAGSGAALVAGGD